MNVELTETELDDLISVVGWHRNYWGEEAKGLDPLIAKLEARNAADDTVQNTDKLDDLVSNIFEIIDTYYIERQAEKIKTLILEFCQNSASATILQPELEKDSQPKP